MNCSFFFFVVLMRKMIKPIGQGSSMIGPNCTQTDIQPSFLQNARSFIKARSHDNRFLLWIIFLVSCKSKCLRAGFVLAVLGVAAVSRGACGRNGPPELPPGPIFNSYQPPATEPVAQPIGAPAAAAPAMPAPPGSPEDLREKQYEKAAMARAAS
jgi:hypothetical protein